MATTNNFQGDEPPRSTALERQVQTLMATVERLTKQNHDLEEQLRQRDAGHNVQEKNQEDSPERGEQERPKGSNALSRPERQNLSLPSLNGYSPTTYCRRDAGDERTNGGHDERPQGTNVQQP